MTVLALSPSQGEAVQEQSQLALESCQVMGVLRAVRCGTYVVPEDPRKPEGRQISLKIVVLPARRADSTLVQPLFYLAGGPGGAASQAAPAFDLLYPSISDNFDIILVDQRGTGGSNPLMCDFADFGEVMKAVISVNITPERLRECRSKLDADLQNYTTPIAMDDLEQVRAALGYEKVNILASSYGTRAALVYLRQHPTRVRSLVLQGVAPLSFKLAAGVATDAQAALDSLFARCGEVASCAEHYPDLKGRLGEVLDRLAASPSVVTLNDPATKEALDFEITPDIFAGGIRLLLYVVPFAARIPLILGSAYEGDFQPFLSSTTMLVQAMGSTLHFGLYLSVACSEDVPFIDEGAARAEARLTFHGDALVRYHIEACRDWPRGQLPSAYSQPVASGVPVLLISGAADPVTGPRWGEEAAKHLSNSLHLVVPNAAHADAIGPCEQGIISEFVLSGTVEAIDQACVSQRAPPAFAEPGSS